jgi:hypothetical protein
MEEISTLFNTTDPLDAKVQKTISFFLIPENDTFPGKNSNSFVLESYFTSEITNHLKIN